MSYPYSYLFRFGLRGLVLFLCSWTFLGWVVRAVTVGLKMDPPLIPGWFEIYSSTDGPVMAMGIGLTFVSIFTFFYCVLLNDNHYMESLSLFLERNFTFEELQMRITHLPLVLLSWSLFITFLGIALNYSSDGTMKLIESVPLWYVIVDVVVTFVTYFVQFLFLGLAPSFVGIICLLHHIDTMRFLVQLKERRMSIDEAIAIHVTIKQRLMESAERIQRYVIVATMVPLTAFVVMTFAAVAEKSPGFTSLYRFYFPIVYFIPICVGWLRCCSVSNAMHSLFNQLSDSTAADFQTGCATINLACLYSYLTSWRLSRRMSFQFIGFEITYTTFGRMLYIVLTLMLFAATKAMM